MRAKSGVVSHRKRVKVRKATKGMKQAPRSSYRLGKQAVTRSLHNAYRDRRNKKRDFRRLWVTRINAAARENGTTYSELMANLKASKIELDRKILAELAYSDAEAFKAVVDTVKK